MGGLFGGGGGAPAPAPVPPVPPAAQPATLANPAVSMAGVTQRQQAAASAGAGFNGTIQNAGGAGGTAPTSTAGKSLLG